MDLKPFKPTKFIIKLRTGSGIPIGEIKTANQDIINYGLNIPALNIFRVIARKGASDFCYFRTLRKNCNAVPAFLSMPYSLISRFTDSLLGEFFLRSFQFLQADNIGG